MCLLSVLFSQTWTEVQLNHKIRAKHKQNQNIASKYIRCYEPIGFCSIPSEMGSYRIIHRRQAVKHTHTQKRHYAACSKQFNFQSIPFPNWLLFRKLSSLVWLKRPMGDAKAKQNRKRKFFWPFFLVRKNSLKMNNHFLCVPRAAFLTFTLGSTNGLTATVEKVPWVLRFHRDDYKIRLGTNVWKWPYTQLHLNLSF